MSKLKVCKKCGLEKSIDLFAKYRYKGVLCRKATCRDCYKPSRQRYYNKNSERIIKHNSKYKKQHRTQVNEREKARKENNIEYRLYSSVRSVVKMSIKRNNGTKNGATLKYLTYTFDQLKQNLESRFELWMTWENWGVYNPKTWDDNNQATWTWQVDHIIPRSDLPYDSMEHPNFQKCWALENLRPLSAKQNVKEGPARIRHKKVA